MNSPLLRTAGKDLLSLALLDARNHTLRWLAVYEAGLDAIDWRVPMRTELNPPLWEAGHIGWFQEHWIGRHVQRQRGTACDPSGVRLASIEPRADGWYDSSAVPHASRWSLDLPGLQSTKDYLAATMEITLDLLDTADVDGADRDAGLYFYRLALFHEDMHGESFAAMAQTLGLRTNTGDDLVRDLLQTASGRSSAVQRPPLTFSPMRWTLGLPRGDGFVFDNETGEHEVALPEFEIDAQAVTWAQYADFVEDGGYDDARWWSTAGWQWVQREGRRVPRHVDQMRQGVLQRRFGVLVQRPMQEPVVHVSWHEADAWCRWAGRRLPTEVEWEAAAHTGAARGFRWGDVWEWTETPFRAYPGFTTDPYRDYSQPWFGTHKVLRGASFATSGRLRHPKFRNFYRPERDDLFSGFRSSAA
ncbi:MAG: selenoneine synthase SenA [Pseudomonadota bacterium]|nr:selenoneine synthase SenA [Pseudomonadota bacterium]